MSKELQGINGVDYVVCQVCGKRFKSITLTHLKVHNINMNEYRRLYPKSKLQCLNTKNKRWNYPRENEIIDDKIECLICHKHYNKLSGNHLKSHGLTTDEYSQMFPNARLISDGAIDNYSKSKIGDKHPLNALRNRDKNREIISLTRKQFYVDHPGARTENGKRSRQYYIDHPEARKIASMKSTEQWSIKENRDRMSAIKQGIEFEDWNGYTNKSRPHIVPSSACIHINDPFIGCHGHHITKSIIINIPAELHTHIKHNLKTGNNMGEINILALQYINGCYND